MDIWLNRCETILSACSVVLSLYLVMNIKNCFPSDSLDETEIIGKHCYVLCSSLFHKACLWCQSSKLREQSLTIRRPEESAVETEHNNCNHTVGKQNECCCRGHVMTERGTCVSRGVLVSRCALHAEGSRIHRGLDHWFLPVNCGHEFPD